MLQHFRTFTNIIMLEEKVWNWWNVVHEKEHFFLIYARVYVCPHARAPNIKEVLIRRKYLIGFPDKKLSTKRINPEWKMIFLTDVLRNISWACFHLYLICIKKHVWKVIRIPYEYKLNDYSFCVNRIAWIIFRTNLFLFCCMIDNEIFYLYFH